MTNLKYSGYLDAYSGMGNAARNIVMAFHHAGANVTTEIIPNVSSSASLGGSYQFCKSIQNADIPYTIKIIHTTPDMVMQHLEPMRYHIFHLFWETSKLPDWWVWFLNHSVDEVWTGCEWNKKVFQESGVKKPIFVCPQPVAMKNTLHAKPFRIPNFSGYLFGSIFQWIERKDPKTLLQSFWKAFEGKQDVGLLIKTYKETGSSQETNEIVAQIKDWKKELGLSVYPRVFLCPNILDSEDVTRLYATMDCFVSTHRGEGFGIPIGEAMLMGKPVISTNLGGIHEHIPKEFWYPIEYTLCPVFNMDWVPWYSKDQQWGQINAQELEKTMISVYLHQINAVERGKKACAFVQENLSYQKIGERMIERLRYI